MTIEQISHIVVSIVALAGSVMLGIISYFGKKLVDDVKEHGKFFCQLNTNVSTLNSTVTDIKTEVIAFRKVETDVAILKTKLKIV